MFMAVQTFIYENSNVSYHVIYSRRKTNILPGFEVCKRLLMYHWSQFPVNNVTIVKQAR